MHDINVGVQNTFVYFVYFGYDHQALSSALLYY